MGERKWITRDEIAGIHDRLADMAMAERDLDHAIDHDRAAAAIRQIDTVGRGIPR